MNKGKAGKAIGRIAFILLIVELFLSGCQSLLIEKEKLPVIVIDQEHDLFTMHTDQQYSQSRVYEIPPGKGFLLDISDDSIQIPSHLATYNVTNPNRLVVYLRQHHYAPTKTAYFMDWNDNETSLEISVNTLMLLEDPTEKIREFDSGQEMEIVVYFYDNDDQVPGEHLAYPLWLIRVDVR